MSQITGAEVASNLGAASDAMELATDQYRTVDQLTRSERRRLNESMDDLICSVERVKIAHTRLLERAGQQPGGIG